MDGKYVLITGGTGDLGQAVVAQCAQRGAQIILPYRGHEGFEQLKARMDTDLLANLTAVQADLLNEQDIKKVIRKMSRIDILIHIMGGFAMGKTMETSLHDWRFQLDLNLTSAFLMIRSCLPLMLEQGGGRIVTVGSKAAVETPAGMAAYSASKAGLIALTKSVANELKSENITANIVLPSTIDTPANRSVMGDKNASRWVTPQSVAKVITFLVSDASADITGAVVPVYGRV